MMTTPKLWCIFLSAANKRSKTQSILLLFLFFIQVTLAQEVLPSFQPEFIQKNQTGPQYQVGDRIQLSIRVSLVLSQQLTNVQLKSVDDKNPLDKQGWYLDPTPQVINGNLRFVVSPIKSGKLVLPELFILTGESSRPIAKTTPLSIDVAELNIDPSSTPAFLDAISISLPMKFIFFGVLILLSLFAIGVVVYRKFFAKKVIQPINEIKIPPKPDDEIALRDLNLLYAQYPFSKENLKPIAFGVSQILKNFFSSRFKVDARESTTDEMLVLLKKESLPDHDLKKIRLLFQSLDQIKFTDSVHHQHFQKGDYSEFKELAKSLIESWALKGGNP